MKNMPWCDVLYLDLGESLPGISAASVCCCTLA